jgi:DNA replication and repair protein RecF
MTLSKLSLQSFRNLENMTIEFCNGFNIFYGENAQGKTNILESIYLLSTLKSFRLAKNFDLIGWEKQFALIKGLILDNSVNREVALLLERGNKKALVDHKAVVKASDFFGILTVVLFAPEEMTMVRAAPELRRRYLDRAIFAGDIVYLTKHHEYSKILKQRNSVLKSGDFCLLEPWNEQLAVAGAQIVTRRVCYIGRLELLLGKIFKEISGTDDTAGILYKPANTSYTNDLEENRNRIKAALSKLKDQEQYQRSTLIGPHRDDILFTLNGKNLRNASSQGQQRCFVLALKMAEIELLKVCHNLSPTLLLDDMTSELDNKRTSNLLQFLTERKLQVFVTTTTMERFEIIKKSVDVKLFHVKQGTVIR